MATKRKTTATRKPPAKKRKTPSEKKQGFQYWGEVFGIILILLAILSFASLITYHTEDLNVSGDIHNKLGYVGAAISWVLVVLMGRISFVMPVFLIVWGYYQLRGGLDLTRALRLIMILISILFICALSAFLVFGTTDDALRHSPDAVEKTLRLGGAVGMMLKDILTYILGYWGGLILGLILLTGLCSYIFDFDLIGLMKITVKGLTLLWNKLLSVIKQIKIPERSAKDDEDEIVPEARTQPEKAVQSKVPTPPPVKTARKEKEKKAKIPKAPKIHKGAYELPPIELLSPIPTHTGIIDRQWLKMMRENLDGALEEYNVAARVIEILPPGPRITRFELELEPGEKVNSITKVEQELAIALKVPNITIAASPGRGTVSVDIPNEEADLVTTKEILSDAEAREAFEDATLPLIMGRASDGTPLIADLVKMPHLLIAGTTGSGKSVFLNSIVLGLLMLRTPFETQFLIIDPKRVDLSGFAQIPHRFRFKEIISDAEDAIDVLKYAVKRMEGRYKLLGHFGARNIEGYNKLFTTKGGIDTKDDTQIDEEQGRPLPYIVIVIDELGDLMMQEARKVEENLIRLAQMARAVGIHLIVATQRPSVDVITGVIKANFPSRVAFKVMSKTDSRTIIDRSGAETLLKNGDMLFLPVGASEATRIQGIFSDDNELKEVVGFWAKQPPPLPLISLKDAATNGNVQGFPGTETEPEDELYDQAVRVVVNAGQASQSMLQRKLRVGFARAGRLIDTMEQNGVVGPPQGTKSRDVLIGPEDLPG